MKTFNFKNKTEVLDLINNKSNNVKFVRIMFPDVLGKDMNFTIPSSELKDAFDSGKGFDGSSIEGFARIEESDLIIIPDPKTFRVLPWEYELNGTTWREAIVFGDIFDSKGDHFLGDPRYILKKTIKDTEKSGQLKVGPELEFFIFPSEYNPKPTDNGAYFWGGKYGEIRKASQIYLKEIGIETDYDHHEVSPGQHEIDIKYGDVLDIADSILIAKHIIKRTARKLGLFASFMPKPLTEYCGNGMHLHFSLWKNNENLFFKKKSELLSHLARKYIMGLIKYGKEIQAGLNQWANSYKRLVPGYEAPIYLSWGRKNRSVYVRVPTYQQGQEKATRIELRNSDPACNPYIALSLIHAAGIKGIRENLEFTDPVEEDLFKMSSAEREKRKIEILSRNLGEALTYFKNSKLVEETLGDHLFNKFIQNKEIEWLEYSKATGKDHKEKVSSYEIKEFLPLL